MFLSFLHVAWAEEKKFFPLEKQKTIPNMFPWFVSENWETKTEKSFDAELGNDKPKIKREQFYTVCIKSFKRKRKTRIGQISPKKRND